MNQRPIRPSSAQQNVSHMSDKNASFLKNPYKQVNQQNVSQYRVKESEKLIEDNQQLKVQLNQFKDENIKLRTRNTNLEKDLQKCQKIIEEVEATGNMKRFYAKPSTDNQMILSLKSQVKELRQMLDQREQDMLQLKKSVKYTRLTEMEIERKHFQDETLRMKQIIEELIQQNLYAQQKEKDQQKLQEMVQQRDNLIKQMQEDIEQLEIQNKNLESQQQQLIIGFQDLDKEYVKLDQSMQAKLKSKDKIINELKNNLKRIQDQIEKEKKITQHSKGNSALQTHNKQQKRIQSAKPSLQITKPVQQEEIQDLIQEIKYKLIALQKSSHQIDNLLFSETSQQTTISQLTEKLINDPFFLERMDAQNLARFLIESPQQKYPYTSNMQISQDNGLIRGLFFKTIGYWACYDQVETKVIESSLAKVFSGTYSQFQKQMNKKTYTKNEFINQISKILQGKTIRELELTYLISKIILQSKHLNTLKGDYFIEYLKQLQQVKAEDDITVEDLQQYYDNKDAEKGFFYYKQQRSKQEQMIALLETKEEKIADYDALNDGTPQKSVQQYLIKGGLVRSHSDPDPLQMKMIEQEDEGEEQENYDEQKQYEQQYDQYNETEYENDFQPDLNDAQIEDDQEIQVEDDDEYNINVDGVFEEDNDDENDQWEKVENHKGNFPVRQDRQIPNSRPTSSYINKVNRSNSDIKASLQSELHPTKEVNEEEYQEDQFEDEN
ncbi:unnamed protein product [Paramecium primaurelia]|uniref:Uncharacterized protein n=1 Tax=Paramecium primaurelia TaxID=5886 RepID=A0A8S1PFE8_PARPR|nr:unnamed protein product [Paramecium primaurelia]